MPCMEVELLERVAARDGVNAQSAAQLAAHSDRRRDGQPGAGTSSPAPSAREQPADTRDFTDAEVHCGKGDDRKTFKVNRLIVCTASEVMGAAFSIGMEEATVKSITVDVDGATPASVENMLEFMYTKHVPTGADPVQLLPLAHFYQLPHLLLRKMAPAAANGMPNPLVLAYLDLPGFAP
eukprot:gene4946-17722_t